MTSDYNARAVLAAAAERVNSLPTPLRSVDGDALLWRSQVLTAIRQVPAQPAYACLVCIPGEFTCPDCEATP